MGTKPPAARLARRGFLPLPIIETPADRLELFPVFAERAAVHQPLSESLSLFDTLTLGQLN